MVHFNADASERTLSEPPDLGLLSAFRIAIEEKNKSNVVYNFSQLDMKALITWAISDCGETYGNVDVGMQRLGSQLLFSVITPLGGKVAIHVQKANIFLTLILTRLERKVRILELEKLES